MKLRGEAAARSLLVNESFDLVAKIPFLKNKWITTQAWFNLIKKEVPNCAINDVTLRWFTAYLLNSGKFIQDSNYPSPDGFYSRKRKMKLDGMIAQKTITCFLVTDAGELPPINGGRCWTESIITAIMPSHVRTRSGIHSTYTQISSSNVAIKRKRSTQTSTPDIAFPQATRPHLDLATTQGTTQGTTQPTTQIPTTQLASHTQVIIPIQLPFESQHYWNSTEAKNLFGIVNSKEDDYDDIREVLYVRLLKFKKAILTCDGWKYLMEDEDRHNKCHAAFVFNIRRKSQYLYHAINFALKEKGENLLTWRQICDRAVEHIKKFEDNDDLPESHFPKSSWITGKTIMR